MEQRIAELVSLIQVANQQYYGLGEGQDELLSDEEYDALLQELAQLEPEHVLLTKVGIALPEEVDGKRRHQEPMLSSAKVKSVEELLKWVSWLELPSVELLAQPKVDGLSATLRFEQGQLVYIASRGDGQEGQDISHLRGYLQGIVEHIPEQRELEVRGELYLPKDTAYDTQGKPLRNNCVGLVNRKEVTQELSYVHFVAYALIDNQDILAQSERLNLLAQWGFAVVESELCCSAEQLKSMSERYLAGLREAWRYETDGLIFIVNNTPLHASIDARKVVDRYHHYSMALKPPASSKESRLVGIEWQISRQGLHVPIAEFEPIVLGGATLSRATLNNVSNVEALRLHLGHRLLLERANDVIPYVKSNQDYANVTSVDTSLIPQHCLSCQAPLVREGVHLKCVAAECPEVAVQTIVYWVKSLQIKEVGAQTIRKLYDEGKIRNPSDLYRLTYEDLITLDGFGEKRVENLLKEVAQQQRMTTLQFLSILGIPLVARRALVKLGIRTIEQFFAFNDRRYVIGQNIIEWKEEQRNKQLVADLLSVLTLEDEESATSEPGKLRVVFTGKGPISRNALKERALQAGYEVEDALSSTTQLVVAASLVGESSKLKKAKERGVRVVTYEQFLSELMGLDEP